MADLRLKKKIDGLLESWQEHGFPSGSQYAAIAKEMLEWKYACGIGDLWIQPPIMLTATLDDGWGNGLELIHLYAKLTGIEIIQLGVLQPVAKIVEACNKYLPDILGLTILQFDSLEDLDEIKNNIPTVTNLIVGGPIFRNAKNNNWRDRGYYAARDVSSLLNFLQNEIN